MTSLIFVAPGYVADNLGGLAQLRTHYSHVRFAGRRDRAMEEAVRLGPAVTALLIGVQEVVDEQVLASLPNLRTIGSLSVGTDHLALDPIAERGIRVITAAGSNGVSVAEHALALVLALIKELTAAQSAKEGIGGRFNLVRPPLQLSGRTVGTVGAGSSAEALHRLLAGFSCRQRYWTPHPEKHFNVGTMAEYRTLPELFRECNIVSIHLPLLDATRGLIEPEHVDSMPRNGVLVNVARGSLLDRADIAAVLVRRIDLRYGVDDRASRFVNLGNRLISTPHTAGITSEALLAMQNKIIGALTDGAVRG